MPFPVKLSPSSIARIVAAGMCLVSSSSSIAFASPVTFTGEDLGAGSSSAHPNSSAAAASFAAAAAALGSVSTISFESAPLGTFTSLSAAPGVTITGTDANGNSQSIRNTPSFPANTTVGGFNTTPGGSQYLLVEGGTLVFTFATPTQFFGAYLSGIQTNFFQDTFTFSDGTTQTINVPGMRYYQQQRRARFCRLHGRREVDYQRHPQRGQLDSRLR